MQGGGNLVLTDGALKAVSELTNVPGAAINERVVYVGQTSFQVCETFNDDGTCETKETLDDPLADNVDQHAARFNTGMRRQTFESTPLGFAIQSPDGGDASFARQFDIKQPDWVAAGGRPAGGSVNSGARDAQGVPERTTLGELALGQGKIRILGALLPQPSTEYDHPLGLEPYAVTYTGYILFCNLVDCQYERKSRPRAGEPTRRAGPGQRRLRGQAEDATACKHEHAQGPQGAGADPEEGREADQAPAGAVPPNGTRNGQDRTRSFGRG